MSGYLGSGQSSSGQQTGSLTLSGSSLPTSLMEMLVCDDIQPGSDAGYELCKLIYLYHPLGSKMVSAPVNVAQSQAREITVLGAPERVVKAFQEEWHRIGADRHIANLYITARVYGISSIVVGTLNETTDKPIDLKELWKSEIYFNLLDPLNSAGSMVLDQDPNSPDFQKVDHVTANGQVYHRSRACVAMNESPVYIAYTSSAFGYVGRSVYQRALFPLKSFVQTMITDDMVARKAGVLVAKLKAPGSIADRIMALAQGVKRSILQAARTDNVISISTEEDVLSLDLHNVETALATPRKNILENIAAADDMPAIMLNSETFAMGLAEGTEDAKRVSAYVDRKRLEMKPGYDFFDTIVMHRAWSPDFFESLKEDFPQYAKTSYNEAFYSWKNAFFPKWPSLLTEPESELVKVSDVKLKAIIAILEVLLPEMDPDNKASVIQWCADNVNDQKLLFNSPLDLDVRGLLDFLNEQKEQAEQQQQQAAAQAAGGGGPPGGSGGGGGPPQAAGDAPQGGAAAGGGKAAAGVTGEETSPPDKEPSEPPAFSGRT